MRKGTLKSTLGLALWLAATAALFAPGCGDDSAASCTEGTYACSGTVLQQCSGGVLVDQEDCDGKGTCMAEMGHCHPGGAGGGHEGGMHAGGGDTGGAHVGGHHAGGHHAGGHHAGGAGGTSMGGGGSGA